MKKLSFGLISFLFTFIYFPVQAESMCSQVVQAAVNYRGECQQFSNPCQVPKDWKKVPSCDLIEANTGVSLEEKSTNRRYTFFRAKPAENQAVDAVTYKTNNRYGSGNLTRGNVNRTGDLDEKNTRKYTTRYGRSSLHTKSAGANATSIKDKGTYQRIARASGPLRTGYLENKPKWEVQQQNHVKKLGTDFENKPWESNIQTQIKERLEKKRKQKEAYLDSLEKDKMDVLKQGGYRDSSIGDLNSYTERSE